LSVGIVCQKPYEEPDERLSAALFLLGSAINDADDDRMTWCALLTKWRLR
jgi:hypothetical protein